MKEYDKAISDYTKAIELEPNYAEVYNNRGYLFYKIGKYEKAFVDLNKSIELNPNSDFTYDSRGCTYAGIKEYDKAIFDFNKAIELNRIFVTRDRDYGNLVFVKEIRSGVLYLRILPSNINFVHVELERILNLYEEAELKSAFVVIEAGKHRFRKI